MPTCRFAAYPTAVPRRDGGSGAAAGLRDCPSPRSSGRLILCLWQPAAGSGPAIAGESARVGPSRRRPRPPQTRPILEAAPHSGTAWSHRQSAVFDTERESSKGARRSHSPGKGRRTPSACGPDPHPLRDGPARSRGSQRGSSIKVRVSGEARGSLKLQDSDVSHPVPDETVTRDMLEILSLWTDLRVRLAPAAKRDAAKQESARDPRPGAKPNSARLPSFSQPRKPALTTLTTRAAPAQPQAPHRTTTNSAGRFSEAEITSTRPSISGSGLELRPQDFWLNFYEGLCKYRTGKFEEAVHAFHICIVLSPDTAECYLQSRARQPGTWQPLQGPARLRPGAQAQPESRQRCHESGRFLYRQGHLNEATASLEQAIGTAS